MSPRRTATTGTPRHWSAPTGTLVAVTGMEVDDVMGLSTTCRPVADWSMFHVSGRRPGELLIWPTVANPLTGTSVLDEVLIGVDEDANVLWAVEQRVDGIELSEPDPPVADAVTEAPPGQVVATGARRYRYLPSTTVPHLWHPYLSSDAGGVRRFVQGRLADLGVRPVAPRPGPTSRLLRDPAATPTQPRHRILPERGAARRAPPRTALRPRAADRRPARAVGAATAQRPRRATCVQPPFRRARRAHRRRDLSSHNWARSVSGRGSSRNPTRFRAQIVD